MKNMMMATDRNSKLTFIFEVWRKGSKTIHASVMPAIGPHADKRIEYRRVPLYLRRAAKQALFNGL